MNFDDSSDGSNDGLLDRADSSSIRRALDHLREAFPDGQTKSERSSIDAGFKSLEEGDGEAKLGRFMLLERLGEGTFSSVFLAQDELLERLVALKVPKPEVLLSAELLDRFLSEARLVSRLHHPNIVPVLDAKADGFEYFIAREYCEGPNLAEWLSKCDRPLEPRVAAAIVAQLAEAVQHANDRGILHRDIKPSNVLLQRRGDEDSEFPFTVLLSDFGLAKVLDHSTNVETATGAMLGTPRYMAPEQARGSLAVGSPAEVYSLGVTLYELITLTVPFESDDHVELMTMISEAVPAPVRKHNRDATRDLEAITMKCLEKSPGRRYPSAAELGADLRRFLRAEPVVARRLGPGRKIWRWAYRHPALAAVAATVIAAASIVYATLLNRDARVQTANESLKRSLVEAEASRRDAQQVAYAADMRLAGRALAEGDVRQLRRLIQRHLPRAGSEDLRGFEWNVLNRAVDLNYQELKDNLGPVNCVRYSGDGRRLATCGDDGFLRVYDAESLELHSVTFLGFSSLASLAFSPDSAELVTAHSDGSVAFRDAASGEQIHRIQAHDEAVTSLIFSPDGERLYTASKDTTIRVWQNKTDTLLGELSGHQNTIDAISISGSGEVLASVSRDRTLRLWDVSDPNTMAQQEVIVGNYRFTSVAVSDDSQTLLAGSLVEGAHGWRLSDRPETFVSPHLDPVESVAFDPTGRWAADADRAGVIRLSPLNPSGNPPWAESAWTPISWCGHDQKIRSICFSPDGKSLATADNNGSVRVWSTDELVDANANPLRDGGSFVGIVPLNQHTFVTADASTPSVVRKWDYATKTERLTKGLNGRVTAISASPDGRSIFLAYASGTIEQRAGDTFTLQGRIDGISPFVQQLTVSGDGTLLCAWTDRGLHWFDAASHEPVRGLPDRRCNAVAISGDGRWLALGAKPEDTIEIWDLSTRELARVLARSGGSINALRFGPDHTTLAAGDDLREIKLWNAVTGILLMTLEGEVGRLDDLAFFPDQNRLVSVTVNRAIRIWHLPTGRQLLELRAPTPNATVPANSVIVSPDGNQVLACLTTLQIHAYVGQTALGLESECDGGQFRSKIAN